MTGGGGTRRLFERRKRMSKERMIEQEISLPKNYHSPGIKLAGLPMEHKDKESAESRKAVAPVADDKSEEQAHDRKQNELHRFEQRMEMLQPISGVGEAVDQTVKQRIENADENYQAGLQEARKYVDPVMDIAALAGAKELAKGIRAELNQITIASSHAYELIRDGKLSMVDLGDQKLLKDRLEKLDGISTFQRRQVLKFRETIYDSLVVKDALERRKNRMDELEEPLRKHLESMDFFDLQQQKINELLKIYFKTGENDVLKKVNPAMMSDRNIGKLLNTRERNGFTDMDISAIRLARRQMKYRESRIRIGRMINIKGRIKRLSSYSYRMDGTAGEGINQMVSAVQIAHTAVSLGKLGLKTGIVLASFMAKYTGAGHLLQMMNQKRQEMAAQWKEKDEVTVRSSKTFQTVKKKAETVRSKSAEAKEKLEENSAVQKYKEVQAKAKEKTREAGKKVNQKKAAAKAAGQKVKQGKDIALTPVRLVGKAINGIRGFFGKIRLILLAGVGIAIAVFLIIVVLTNAILTIFQTESNIAVSAILTEDETFIADITEVLQGKASEKRQEAKTIAAGVPKDPAVLEGHIISKYGYPDENGSWTDGSEIIYLDGNGNVVLNGMNNIKDCVVMAYVIMDGDFDSDETARDQLILDLWEIMNPEVTYQESDIYTCPYGCDRLSYSCDSWNDYVTMNAYKADGVGFYGDVEGYRYYGDSYTVTCNGCKDSQNRGIYHDIQTGTGTAQMAEGCVNYSVEYDCYGHSVAVCYGHRDVEVYVKVRTMEEMFESGVLPSGAGKRYQPYLSAFPGWTEDNREWARLLYSADWFDLYGVDPAGGTGYAVGSGMTQEEIDAIIDTYGDVDATRTAICSDAMSFVGQIPYYWGGKASAKDYAANNFNSVVTPDDKGRNRKGLDCSGFVQWIIWRVTDVKLGASTSTIAAGMEPISAAELQPGDLGLMAVPGSASNHVGIFVGYNEDGQALWCHENSSAGNVSVNNTTCFRYFYRIF